MVYIKTAWSKKMTDNCMPDGFYFALRSQSPERCAQTYEMIFFLNFCSLGHFFQVFEQIKEYLLEL